MALNDLQVLVLAARGDVVDPRPRASFIAHMSVTMTHIFHHVQETNRCSFLITLPDYKTLFCHDHV